MRLTSIALLLLVTVMPAAPAIAAASPLTLEVSAGTKAKVAAAQEKLRAAILGNDVDARLKLYRPDARSMPEYQPALYGAEQIAAYNRAMQNRLKMTRFDPVTSELFDFGDAVLEYGTFTAGWAVGAKAEERRGKYANLWGVEPDGSLRLKADVWGYFENLPEAKLFFVPMAEAAPPLLPAPSDPALAETIARLDRADAKAVRTRDLEAKLALLADDAVIMPFADTPKRGMAEIRPYMAAYTAAGEGVAFDDVRVWNAGFEQFGDYVVTYPKFHVDWRFPGKKGDHQRRRAPSVETTNRWVAQARTADRDARSCGVARRASSTVMLAACSESRWLHQVLTSREIDSRALGSYSRIGFAGPGHLPAPSSAATPARFS